MSCSAHQKYHFTSENVKALLLKEYGNLYVNICSYLYNKSNEAVTNRHRAKKTWKYSENNTDVLLETFGTIMQCMKTEFDIVY